MPHPICGNPGIQVSEFSDSVFPNPYQPDLPECAVLLAQLVEALRAGAPQVVGHLTGPQYQRAFDHGWNSNADRLWTAAGAARAALAQLGLYPLKESDE